MRASVFKAVLDARSKKKRLVAQTKCNGYYYFTTRFRILPGTKMTF